MADFLTNLAIRIGEPVGLIRPRLPSAFEPSPLDATLPAEADGALADGEDDSPGSGLENAQELEAAHVRVSLPSVPSPVRRTAPRRARAAEANVDTRDERADEPEGLLVERPARTNGNSRPERSPAANERDRSAAGRAGGEPGRSDEPPISQPPQFAPGERGEPPIRRAGIVRPAADAAPVPERAERRKPRQEDSADAAAASPRTAGEPPTARPVMRERPSPQAQDFVHPRVARREQPAPPTVKADTTAHEPTVHVTIGRVEVRAVSAAPPARKERDASPVMSLDEYLRTRARRGDA